MSMRILIDARCVGEQVSGISRHAVGLISKIFEIDSTNRYILLVRNAGVSQFGNARENVEIKILDVVPYSLKEQIVLPKILKEIDFDLYYTPNYTVPLFIDRPFIFTIHDLIHLIFPRDYTIFHRIYYALIIKRLCERARYVLTVSNSSKADIVRFFKTPQEKIIVNYNGVSEKFFPGKKDEAKKYISERFGIEGKFILWVGNDKPHKNLGGVIKMFSLLSQEECFLSLICIGSKNIKNSRNSVMKRVFSPSIQGDGDLVNFYRSAEVLVVPSLYEGFCLPVLEALASGCPVVTSNVSSLPEVVGDAGIMVNPDNVREITDAVLRILRNDSLRDELIKKGIEQAKKFSWESSAKNLLRIFSAIQ